MQNKLLKRQDKSGVAMGGVPVGEDEDGCAPSPSSTARQTRHPGRPEGVSTADLESVAGGKLQHPAGQRLPPDDTDTDTAANPGDVGSSGEDDDHAGGTEVKCKKIKEVLSKKKLKKLKEKNDRR